MCSISKSVKPNSETAHKKLNKGSIYGALLIIKMTVDAFKKTVANANQQYEANLLEIVIVASGKSCL